MIVIWYPYPGPSPAKPIPRSTRCRLVLLTDELNLFGAYMPIDDNQETLWAL